MLARISHQLSTAAADPGMSTALRSVGLLDILSSMHPGPSIALAGKLPDAPCIHARLRHLATKPGEKSGLGAGWLHSGHSYFMRQCQPISAALPLAQ